MEKFFNVLVHQPIQKYDNHITEEVTNHLFERTSNPYGFDLISLNIQRAREHGLKSYNDYRSVCGMTPVRNFEDLKKDFLPGVRAYFHFVFPQMFITMMNIFIRPVKLWEKFSSIYDSVDDIDLFPAGISERPVPGAIVGPIFQCIIAEQFKRLKTGDRFFYDLGLFRSSFTLGNNLS